MTRLIWAAALAVMVVSPLAAQQEQRAPGLVWRAERWQTSVERLPTDSLLEFDPQLGFVVPRRAHVLPVGARRPAAAGLKLETYTRRAQARMRDELWAGTVVDRLSGRAQTAEGLIPELENPLRVPAPLAAVFGEGSVFDVQGKLHLGALGSRSTQDPDIRSELLRRAAGGFDLDLDQTLDLKILGTVGTKLDVEVDFNSQRELESKQLISLAYAGTDDEILKQVEVGDIRVALPPSRFLGSGVAQGTFGAQAVAQLGPVDLRVLGSRKEGQTTTRSLSIQPSGDGVLSEVSLDIKDTQFQNDRFFLLFHPDSLVPGRILYPSAGTSLLTPASVPEPGSLNVWLDDGNFTNNRELASKPGMAFINPTIPDTLSDETHAGFFDLLIEGEDYVVSDGVIIQMRRQLNDNEVLAVGYVTTGGTEVGTPQEAADQVLKLIKPINPDTLDFTWDYTLRNVYSLREPNIQSGSLELTIYRGAQDLKETFETIDGESRKYSEIFGVTDVNERVSVPRILRDPFGGPDYLVLPNIRPFFEPTDEIGAPIVIERPNRRLYFNSDPNRTALDDQVYFIEATYLSQGGLTGEIELGAANLIDGSERITIGGEVLTRGEDYQIFYDFGRVVLTDPAGLAEQYPNDRLDINFEVAPLFNLAPTTLYGAAGSYAPAPNMTINSTLMVQRQQSLANRPILGAEPFQTVIGAVDGVYTGRMPFMSRWLDGLPGVDGGRASTFTLRGELAWSNPNPNTDGEVFLNDFENIEVAKRLNLFFRAWSFASIPSQTTLSLAQYAGARWFTFAIDQQQVTGTVRGLDIGDSEFVVLLEPRGETPGERSASWRSIQTLVSTTGEDLTRQEFIEFFLRGNRGTMIVDLGTIDEDAVRIDRDGAPVGINTLDTEETDPNTRDNNLDVDEDVGLDGIAGNDFINVTGDDGTDDFDETFGVGAFPNNPNGTENNSILDTEDNNLNGLLDRQEDIVRWEFDLSGNRFEVPGSRNPTTGFRRIRLPLVSPDQSIGVPDLRNVRAIRLTFTGVENPTEFEIVGLEIVGSTFLQRGIVDADGFPIAGQDSDSLQITAINDVENPEYRSPPGVFAQQDRADEIAGVNTLVREQSLEFGYRGLPAGSRGTIFRPLFDRESYIDYEEMRLWVQGRDVDAGLQPNFFVAFGIDTLNAYEYNAPLRDLDWEEHVIDFEIFTELKRTLLDSLASAGADTGSAVSDDGRYRVRIASPTAPPPTITEISQLTIGVENTTGSPVTGSFWIDEWRLTAPLREGGGAGFISAQAVLADFGRINLTFETRDGRYRNLNAVRNNFDSGDFDLSTTFDLEKMLPESWGIALPLTYDHFGQSDVPLYAVGSDILVTTSAQEDSLERSSTRDIVSLRAFRTRQSSNPIVAATLDKLEARLTFRGEESGSVDLDTDRARWETLVTYRTGFRKRGLPLGLGWVAKLPFPKAIKSSEALQRLVGADLNLVPANVALGTRTLFEERNRNKILASGSDFTADTTRNVVGNAQIDFQPFSSMRASLRWDTTRDLVFPETVISRKTLGVEALRGQSFDFDWTIPIASWLTPRYNYRTTSNRNHSRAASRSLDSLDLRDFGATRSKILTIQFQVIGLVQALRSSGDGRVTATSSQATWWARLFGPIRFDRRQRESVSYVQQEEDPSFGFGWGFGSLDNESIEDPQSFTENNDWGLSTTLQPVRTLQIRGAYRETDNVRRWLQGVNEKSVRTWPDISINWTNAWLPGPVRKAIAAATVSSGFERRTSSDVSNDQLLGDVDRRLWDPVVAVRLTWVNGMSTDFRASHSETITAAIRGGSVDNRREELATDFTVNFNYNIRPGTTLYIPFPTLWKAKLRQPLLTSVSFNRRFREDSTALAGEEEPVLNIETLTTEIRPSVAYEFGRVVSGFAVSYLSRDDRKRDIRNTTVGMEAFLDFLF
jgi:hypothetical protein